MTGLRNPLRSRILAVLCLLFVGLWAAQAKAQLTSGNIAGAVTDQSGAAVPGAKVVVKNTETGVSRETVTGSGGRYEFPSLPSGSYEVTVTATGFQTSVRSGLTLSIGQNVVADHKLQVGAVTQEVTVTGEAPVVETTSATVSQLVDEKKVQDLPLRGRDLTQLAYLQPGVLKTPGSGAAGFSGMGDKLTVNGARQTQNLYLLDGVSNTDLSDNPQGASGAYLGADTVKEFQVITNNYSADYQSAAGAIVSAVSKSGTNSLHGSGFWTTRNSPLDANSWENNRAGNGKRDFKRNQYGGSLGGPIIKDRTFFFGSYEGFKERNNDSDRVVTYTAATRAGLVPTTDNVGRSGNQQGATVTVDPIIKSYLDLWPLPDSPYKYAGGKTFTAIAGSDVTVNAAGQLVPTGVVTVTGPGSNQLPVNEDFVGSHFDHQLGTGKLGTLSGSYNFDKSDAFPRGIMTEVGNGAGPGGSNGTETKKHTIGVKHLSVLTPSSVNEFNFGYSFSRVDTDIPITSTDFSDLATLNGRKLLAQINAPGNVTGVGWRVNHSLYDQKTYTMKDALSMTKGSHSLRLGGEFKWFRYKQDSCSRGCNGVWTWNSISDFLQNLPSGLEVFQPGHDNPIRTMRQVMPAFYFQDNWQVKPSFTLNLGLRYEFVTVPAEDNGLVSTLVNVFDPYVTVTNATLNDPRYKNDKFCNTPGVTPACASSTAIDGFFKNPSLKSFSPRIGFAWAPGDKKTSIRGGAGIFYEYPLLFTIRTSLQESPPFVQTGTVSVASDCATISSCPINGVPLTLSKDIASNPALVSALKGQPNSRSMDYRPSDSAIYRWSLTLQRDLGHGVAVSAGYTGSRGTHLWGQTQANVGQWVGFPNQPTGDKIFPIATGDRAKNCLAGNTIAACQAPFGGFVNPNFGELRLQNTAADSYYHGLALGATMRKAHGLELQAAYNFSKSIDDGSGVTSSGENLPQGQRGVYYFDIGRKRGLSAFDIRNNLSVNYTYELPGQSMKGLAGWIVGGWQTTGIITLTDGHPLSIGDTPTVQRNALLGANPGNAEQNTANLISGGNTNPVTNPRDPAHYYDATNFIPSVCTGIPARVGSIANAIAGTPAQGAQTPGKSIAVCAPGDAEFQPGHFGSLGRDTLTSPGLANMDFSLQKNFRVTEGQRLQFRWEVFNLLNRANFAEPSTSPYSSSSIPNAAFWLPSATTGGQITATDLRPRTMQLGLKYTF